MHRGGCGGPSAHVWLARHLTIGVALPRAARHMVATAARLGRKHQAAVRAALGDEEERAADPAKRRLLLNALAAARALAPNCCPHGAQAPALAGADP